MDVQGHGTHVAGIVAANADNGYGVVGIAPSAKVLAVRVLDAEGSGNYSQVANGIVYAADQGADVINLSLGGPAGAEVLRSAVLYAASRGAVVTCATGNDGADTIGYPARYDGCVAVGATDRYDKRAGFSNRGSGIDITAPGAQVLSTTIGSGHEAWDGTSMATPYVSGVAALLVSQGLRRRAVIDTLRATARDLGASGADTTFGAGRVDAGAAVLAASRQPRALADDVAPTITSVTRGAVERTVKTTYKTKWKVTRRTAWARVGSTDYLGVYSWRRTSTAGTRRTIRYFRMRGGVVYGRTVRQRKTRVAQHAVTSRLPIRVVSSDNVDVDRVALQIDGRTVGVDWSSSDGWMIPVNCSAASHTLTAWAYDAADNEVGARVVMSLAC
jgi:subtilisin family serine protease